MHLQSFSQLRELRALFGCQSQELLRLGAALMDRLAERADSGEGGVQLRRGLQALVEQRAELEGRADQPAEEQAQRQHGGAHGERDEAGRSPCVDYDVPSAHDSAADATIVRSGCGSDAAGRGVASDDDESEGSRGVSRQATC